MWSAPGARVNASNTAVPRTPDAPVQDEAYQNTERGTGILQSSPVTMTFMGLITSPLIAIAPTRSRTHMIMTQCLTVLLYTQPTYSTHVNHLKVRSTTGHDKSTRYSYSMFDTETEHRNEWKIPLREAYAANRCAHFSNGPDTLGVVYQSNKRAIKKGQNDTGCC